jgi:hypothetical protein
MTSLEYSNSAKNAKAAFLGVDFIVYVEGDDDVPFWEELFIHFSGLKVSFESVGGSPELQKIVSDIEDGLLDAIAACDKDYSSFVGELSDCPRILFTYGYSIENSLYVPEVVLNAIRHIGRLSSQDIDVEAYEEWLADLTSKVQPLLVHDLANCILQAGETVLGSNCTRFMTTQTSHLADSTKVSSYIYGLETDYPEDTLEVASAKLNESGLDSFYWLRGHFIESALLKYINREIRRKGSTKKANYDGLFGHAVSNFVSLIPNDSEHIAYYEQQLTSVA